MRKVGGGRIINVTNLGGRTPGPSSMPTSISRAAGIAITKGLSKDLAKENILVTTVCIGLVKSGQHQRRFDARIEKEPNWPRPVRCPLVAWQSLKKRVTSSPSWHPLAPVT